MARYDVALWSRWPDYFPTVTDIVEAEQPYEAIEVVMVAHGLVKVARAAAHLLGTTDIWRYRAVQLMEDGMVGFPVHE
ncbi:hypothetical protein [Ktedonobacter racemifer]|uniref:Uncharacterized protein n=1 Tax=Ktedonobacter racemifer DSM 44963 TaxID=485913 RepID=D6TYY2_KTERA|nr:hypothetical protein [Ktedonobacter racemifer]EFH81772.1 hypothetical protein Krac_2519 [Ktedonobacter racemifer DSM 44963]